MIKLKSYLLIALLLSVISFSVSGCGSATYPEERVVSSIKEICLEEYGIEDVGVKVVGRTIGVFLPLEKLFTTDVRHLVIQGKTENLESLFEPEEEAMEKLEDVLFTISRVMLSTDKEMHFYVLKAADVKGTGLQLVLTGHIPDVRRVRLWDIPRSEYRKRVIHELKLNRPILWEENVRAFFTALEEKNVERIRADLFSPALTPEVLAPFIKGVFSGLDKKTDVRYEIEEIKSFPYSGLRALLYVRVRETYTPISDEPIVPNYPSGTELEFIFIVEPNDNSFKILQVIPFQFFNESGVMERTSFPPELQVYQNLDNWKTRFEVEEIFLGEFLSTQLNRRAQTNLIMDERVRLTVQQIRINYSFAGARDQDTPDAVTPHFLFYFNVTTKGMKEAPENLSDMIDEEDAAYVLEVALKELAKVARGYSFKDYEYIEVAMKATDPETSRIRFTREEIELLSREKTTVSELLG